MISRGLRGFAAFVFTFVLIAGTAGYILAMGKNIEVPMMAKEELKSMLGNPEVLILDVREGDSWKKAKMKIQGALREDPEERVEPWASKYPQDKTLVLY